MVIPMGRARALLRPVARMIRQLQRKDVFEVRHWRPATNIRFPEVAETSPLELDFLWYSGPEHMSRVFVDADFLVHREYPLADSELLPLIDVYTATGRRYLSLVHCLKTGVVFHHSLPSHEWQKRFYAENWDATGQSNALGIDEFMKTRSNKVQQILAGAGIKRGGRVLDVGCGYGDQLFYFKERGYKVYGLEPSRHRATFASRLLGTDILNSPVEGDEVRRNLRQLGGKFDVIYLNQVFEHLYDPLSVAKLLREFLDDDGVLMIGVPDYFSECTVLFSSIIMHTHSFTSNALLNLLSLAGFKRRQDLSFPGYLYFTFVKNEGHGKLEDPGTAKVVRHVLRHFDLLSRQLRPGQIVSVASSYTGDMETGYRVKRAPMLSQMRQSLRSGAGVDTEALRRYLPVKVHMPYDTPCIRQK